MALKKAFVKHLRTELQSDKNVKEFSNLLRLLSICDLRDDDQLKAVATTGAIDTLIALYMMGVLSKLHSVKEVIKGETDGKV